MKEFRLTKEEKKTEDALLHGEYVKISSKKLEEISQSLAARKKDLTITIRVNSEDIKKIRRKAAKAGIKYQTFISGVLHQIAQ